MENMTDTKLPASPPLPAPAGYADLLTVCACCGKTEDEHHTFIPVKRPPGCRCSVTDWRDNQHIPPVCESYKSATGGYCDTCEHDANCHAA